MMCLARCFRAAEDFIKTRTDLQTLASSDHEVTRLRAQAESALSLGAFEAARSALTKAIEVDGNSSDRLTERLKERNLSQAASLAARAGVARTRLEYRAAATDLKAAAKLAERWDLTDAWRYRLDQAANLRSYGDELGDNGVLIEAITVYRSALVLAPRNDTTGAWGRTQISLGDALRILGERESGTARLYEAAAAGREALVGITRDRLPLDWASAQINLGSALLTLAAAARAVRNGSRRAVTAYRAALLERTRERVPLGWAETQHNLGQTHA
jgi:tetratricopeptide (TPR) repeat protein